MSHEGFCWQIEIVHYRVDFFISQTNIEGTFLTFGKAPLL